MPFDVWRQLWDAQADWGSEQKLPPLLTHFGTSLVERAVIEAVCRSLGQPFAQALRGNQLGIRLGDAPPHPERHDAGRLAARAAARRASSPGTRSAWPTR